MKVDHTRELFWSRALGSYTEQDAVSWALAEIERQPASPNLAALASLDSPYNHFEVEDLLHSALAELGVKEPDSRQAYNDFLCTTCRAILDGTLTPREGCRKLARAHGGDITKHELQPFWLMELGLEDIKIGGKSWHYRELTPSNLDGLVLRECRALVKDACPEHE